MAAADSEAYNGSTRHRGRPRTRGITTQMNVRVERELKTRGDEILRSVGTNPTDVVARLWSYVARTGTVPSFLTDEEIRVQDEERDRLIRVVDEMRGMPWRRLKERSMVQEEGACPRTLSDLYEVIDTMEAVRARGVAQS